MPVMNAFAIIGVLVSTVLYIYLITGMKNYEKKKKMKKKKNKKKEKVLQEPKSYDTSLVVQISKLMKP